MQQLELQCRDFILECGSADSAHDITHIERVVQVAKHLCVQEQADMAVVLPAAWLHDCVAVAKNHPDRAKASLLAADKALTFLHSIGYEQQYLEGIHHAIVAHSFSANITPVTLEAQIVQDADRMDALGAVGISRCMKVGGAICRGLYHPSDPFCQAREADDGKYTLDHFFVKLLGLAKTMNTHSARVEAQQRTAYMQDFLRQLGKEIGMSYD
ncbi:MULTISPECIES: HD domain-containing protein [unclassified Pseudoalteromonas]|uniref:HD domain-containing protein n=1 Tax=unclassified Pseudoalteromonas TaxID=194690 RepID=UPI000CF67CB1|nr:MULTISPECIES: HD domain-containing protein [unclassified Pseudoalteromonas]MBS3796429.1 HD domain-containing protein [Pseudoalteromonas sp. BDTF-M6]